jgi:hypothetical protein
MTQAMHGAGLASPPPFHAPRRLMNRIHFPCPHPWQNSALPSRDPRRLTMLRPRGMWKMEILCPLRLRYFSPEELLQLFCFEKVVLSNGRRARVFDENQVYRLIGNSVNVFVVSALIQYLTKRAWESHGMCRPRVRVGMHLGHAHLGQNSALPFNADCKDPCHRCHRLRFKFFT